MTSLQRKLPEWMSVQQKEDSIDDKKKSLWKKNIVEDNLPYLKFNGSIVYSYEGNDCSLLSEDIRSSLQEEDVLGFDIEWPPIYTKGKTGKVALIQVCVSEKKCYLFHISPMAGFPKGLRRLLEDESVKKVGVGIEGDQWKLMSDYELKLKGFIELSEVANQKLRCKEKWSLNGLVKHLFKKQLLKDSSIRCSNWDIFPLSTDQKLYAASDAYAGLLIYQKLECMDAHEKVSFCVSREGVADFEGIKRQLTDLSNGFMDLVKDVPSSFGHSTGALRAVAILEDLSEKLEELRSIVKEASKGEGNGLLCHDSEDCSEEDKYQSINLASKELLAENKIDYKNAESKNNKDVDCCQNENMKQDFLGISEEELYMMERKDDEKQIKPGQKSNEHLYDTNEEKNMSYIIESDEEFESEIIKSLEDLDNSIEEAIGTSVHQTGLIPAKSVDTVADEEEDEGIEEEDDDDDWDPSIPEPNAEQVSCLKTYFGHSSFKPVQWKVIHSVLRERRDNLVVMATGYGKSLCYQFAPVYTSGIGIVICPLISLMEDQVLQLEMSNIPSCFLGSAQSKNVLQDVKAGRMRVIYMTPEFCSGGISLLQDLDNRYGITLIAIDEAHCISEWGHDFRSAYRSLGSLKRMLPTVPIVALTATASPSIREDISKSLSLHNPQITCTSFDRPNLYLDVAKKTTNISTDLQQFLIKKQGSGWEFEGATIVYCPTRKTSEQVTAELTKLGIACGTYHAGMGIKQRRDVHHRFMRDEIQCVVATVAFGMGINKPDIRKVIHYGAPKEMESYYQEIGRAGRDGLPSCCHALWTQADINFNRHMLGEIPNNSFREYKLKMLTKMEKYLNSSNCRRKIILSHFEDKQLRKASSGIMGTEKCCDNCKTRLRFNISINDTEDNLQEFGQQAYKFISAVDILGQKFGTGVPVLFLRGSTSQRLPDRFRHHPLFSCGKDQTEAFWKVLARQLISEGYLQESSGHTKFSTICGLTSKGTNWLMKASNQQHPSLLLPSNDELCLRRTTVSNSISRVPSHSSMIPHASPNTRSSIPKAGPEKISLKEKFSYQEAGKLSTAVDVSKSSLKLQTPCKPLQAAEPDVSPKEMELQTTLYGRLVVARQKIASERDIPPAVLATNKVLVDMAKLRPTTIENMKKLDGVSEAKSAMLAPLVEVVKEFCIANSLKMDIFSRSGSQSELTSSTQREQDSTTLPESQRMSYSLFQEQNLSLKKVADARCLSMAAVGMHLWQALKAGYSVDVQRAGLTPGIRKLIIDNIKNPPINSDLSSFKSIRESIPANIDSYLIRMAIALLEKEESNGAQGQLDLPTQKTLVKLEEQPKNISVENIKHKATMNNSLWIEKKPTQPTTAELEETKAKPLAPIMLASWNEPSLDADTEELFSESQSYTTTPKRKLPQWFGPAKGNAGTNAVKKAKTGKKKGIFD